MRIREVRAHAFGPFEDERLNLAEGMTVIVGLNESGKSSWHAAIYAALCGMRRGSGRRKEEREFIVRHQPWSARNWRASCVVDLPDGRTVALTHDLEGGIGSQVRDTALGTDVTSEIIHDGAPDGSRWLGLERRAFLAVASIRQAQILALSEEAGTLQEYLQKAAATAGTDETAAAALAAIDHYAKEYVGTQKAWTKPLVRTTRLLEAAQEEYERAVAQHQEWLEHEARLVELEAKAAQARRQLRAAEARHARQAADQLTDRLEGARRLAERYPSPPSDLGESERLAEQVATALHEWEQRPHPTPLDGATAADLEARLNSLPEPPDGDLEPAAEVRRAHRALLDAQRRYEAHEQQRPAAGEAAPAIGPSESELVDLARALEAPVPSIDPGLREEVGRHRSGVTEGQERQPRRAAGLLTSVAAAAAAFLGAVLLAAGSTVPGAAGIAVGLILGVGAALLLRRPTSSAPGRELTRADVRLLLAEQMAAEARQRRENAARRAEAAGLEPDPARLRRLADEIRHTEDAARARETWEARERDLAGAVATASEALARALTERGVAVETDAEPSGLDEAVTRYEEQCRRRRDAATAAAQRPALEQALAARQRAEAQLTEETARLGRAREALRAAATAAGIVDEADASTITEAELADRLHAWHADRERQRHELSAAQEDWTRLQTLLDGKTLDDLETRANAARERVAELSRGLDPELVTGMSLGDDPEDTIGRLRTQAEALANEAAAAKKQLDIMAEQALSVPEAEERRAAAETELERLQSLDEVLSTTRHFLAAAQEQVHRNIAPVLAAKVGERLARVTAGRYEQVTVDPETLKVHVHNTDGQWRDADLLSHGTAEQVYLLLRIAMAEILTANSAKCPLLLDDSTVQSDPHRTRAILDVLREVSDDHQVILFSQEDDVLAWARDNLTGPRDKLLSLDLEPLRG